MPLTMIRWRRPSGARQPRGADDVIEVGRASDAAHHIVLRLALERSQKIIATPREFTDFVQAAKAGEYDDLLLNG